MTPFGVFFHIESLPSGRTTDVGSRYHERAVFCPINSQPYTKNIGGDTANIQLYHPRGQNRFVTFATYNHQNEPTSTQNHRIAKRHHKHTVANIRVYNIAHHVKNDPIRGLFSYRKPTLGSHHGRREPLSRKGRVLSDKFATIHQKHRRRHRKYPIIPPTRTKPVRNIRHI